MISVCILTKNGASTLKECLDSIPPSFEVVILDNGSSDETEQICKNYPNLRFFQTSFVGFGPLRNRAAEKASHDWIFALDCDEILSPSLVQELDSLPLDPKVAYRVSRHNYYRGKRIRGCGWDPDWVARLYHRKHLRFSDALVHEALLPSPQISLRSPLFHTPYRTTADFLMKMQHYSTLFANQYQGKKKSSFAKALGHALFSFFRSYLLKKGCFCGSEGFIISFYNANTTFYKYLKLAELNNELKK